MRYLITFSCYGLHLHGDESGSVDRDHNVPGSRVLDGDPQLAAIKRGRMPQPPYYLDPGRRDAVLAAICAHCGHKVWGLLAVHVRTTHVHVVVEAEVRPEKVMNELKAYASRELNRRGIDGPNRRRWARHGSTRWLWRTKTSEGLFGMLSRSRANRWRCSLGRECKGLAVVTLPSGRGSETASRSGRVRCGSECDARRGLECAARFGCAALWTGTLP